MIEHIRTDTSRMTYHPERRVLVAEASELRIRPGQGFPKRVTVRSHHTGNVCEFVYDEQAAIQAEFWDGEEAHYRCTEPRANAQHLVIIND